MTRKIATMMAGTIITSMAMVTPAMAQTSGVSQNGVEAVSAATGDVQSATNPTSQTYTPDDFARYNPITALDLVRQVPGFTLIIPEAARGLAVTTSNILINGQPPATKADTPDLLLQRIPAGNVERLELRQADGRTDVAARGLVLNLVLKSATGTTGTWRGRIVKADSMDWAPTGAVSITHDNGRWRFEGGVATTILRVRNVGPQYSYDYMGDLTQRRDQIVETRERDWTVNLGAHGLIGGFATDLAMRATTDRLTLTRDSLISDAQGVLIGNEQLISQAPASKQSYEISLDLERQWSPSFGSKLALVGSRDDGRDEGSTTTYINGNSRQSINQAQQQYNERIARLTNRLLVGDITFQAGAEYARNTLESRFQSQSGANNPLVENVSVAETRIEPFIGARGALTDKLSYDVNLVYEDSTISDRLAGRERHFSYWKPRAILNWTPNGSTAFELTLERRVSQLDFYDFAASIDLLNDGRINAGNADLRPERSWSGRLESRQRFDGGTNITLAGFGEYTNDLIDQRPIIVRDASGVLIDVFDATGNIGDGYRIGAEASLRMPLTAITPGLQLIASGRVRHTEATDPVTYERRFYSDVAPYSYSAELRYDRPTYALDVNVARTGPTTSWYYDERYRFDNATRLNIWAERRYRNGMTARVEFNNLTGAALNVDRNFYTPTRAGVFSGSVERRQRTVRSMLLTLSGRF